MAKSVQDIMQMIRDGGIKMVDFNHFPSFNGIFL